MDKKIINKIKSMRKAKCTWKEIGYEVNLSVDAVRYWFSPKIRKEKIKYSRKYRVDNENEINKKLKKDYADRKYKVLFHYSKGKLICDCCGESEYYFLTLNHKNGTGAKHRKELSEKKGNGSWEVYKWCIKNNFPKGFDVQCMNCNCAESWYGKCPHKS